MVEDFCKLDIYKKEHGVISERIWNEAIELAILTVRNANILALKKCPQETFDEILRKVGELKIV